MPDQKLVIVSGSAEISGLTLRENLYSKAILDFCSAPLNFNILNTVPTLQPELLKLYQFAHYLRALQPESAEREAELHKLQHAICILKDVLPSRPEAETLPVPGSRDFAVAMDVHFVLYYSLQAHYDRMKTNSGYTTEAPSSSTSPESPACAELQWEPRLHTLERFCASRLTFDRIRRLLEATPSTDNHKQQLLALESIYSMLGQSVFHIPPLSQAARDKRWTTARIGVATLRRTQMQDVTFTRITMTNPETNFTELLNKQYSRFLRIQEGILIDQKIEASKRYNHGETNPVYIRDYLDSQLQLRMFHEKEYPDIPQITQTGQVHAFALIVKKAIIYLPPRKDLWNEATRDIVFNAWVRSARECAIYLSRPQGDKTHILRAFKELCILKKCIREMPEAISDVLDAIYHNNLPVVDVPLTSSSIPVPADPAPIAEVPSEKPAEDPAPEMLTASSSDASSAPKTMAPAPHKTPSIKQLLREAARSSRHRPRRLVIPEIPPAVEEPAPVPAIVPLETGKQTSAKKLSSTRKKKNKKANRLQRSALRAAELPAPVENEAPVSLGAMEETLILNTCKVDPTPAIPAPEPETAESRHGSVSEQPSPVPLVETVPPTFREALETRSRLLNTAFQSYQQTFRRYDMTIRMFWHYDETLRLRNALDNLQPGTTQNAATRPDRTRAKLAERYPSCAREDLQTAWQGLLDAHQAFGAWLWEHTGTLIPLPDIRQPLLITPALEARLVLTHEDLSLYRSRLDAGKPASTVDTTLILTTLRLVAHGVLQDTPSLRNWLDAETGRMFAARYRQGDEIMQEVWKGFLTGDAYAFYNTLHAFGYFALLFPQAAERLAISPDREQEAMNIAGMLMQTACIPPERRNRKLLSHLLMCETATAPENRFFRARTETSASSSHAPAATL